jgi:glycosyltransferase involved in cell wall biosynthesis
MSKNKQRNQKPSASKRTTNLPSKPFVLAPGQKLPTIGLSIIVKNEAKVIERMLNTVWPILDYYCVVDTGSTDGTQDIVRNFFAEKGIPGEVIDHEWKNFEDARNTALNAVKGKCDFGFWIDADEQLIIDPRFNKDLFKMSLLGFQGANVKVTYGSQNYFRMQFFSTAHPWRWYGPVHEVLVCDGPHNTGVAEGLTTLVKPDGNSWVAETIQQKYEGHAKILEEYVANDPNKDPRWVFYLAQSYRDAGTPENQKKSMEWYDKRATMMNGFWEEIYYSMLMSASLKGSLQYPIHEIIEGYLKCGKANPHRAEHLIPVMLHYHHMKEFDISYIFSSHAMKFAGKSPFPNSSLFIDPSIYDWRIYDIHSLNCYYSGRKVEGTETFKKLLKAIEKGLVPQGEIPRIQNNKQWFTK